MLSNRPFATDSWNLGSFSNSTFHSDYHTLYEVESFMHEMVLSYPDIIRLAEIGHSAEGREMYALEISLDRKARSKNVGSSQTKTKQGFVITGAQHAREVCSLAITHCTAC